MGRGSSKAGGGGGSVTVTSPDGFSETYVEQNGNIYSMNLSRTPELVLENTSLRTLAERLRTAGYKVEVRPEAQERKRQADYYASRANTPDYSLGYGLGPGGSMDRNARRTARRNRQVTRAARRGGR